MSRPLLLLLTLALLSCSQDAAPRVEGVPPAAMSPKVITTAITKPSVEDGPKLSALVANPVELRLAMEKHFGHHTVLMIRVMRGTIDKEPKFTAAANRAVQRNTKELSEAITAVYGASASADFTKLWTQRTKTLTAYSAARARNDRGAILKAQRKLQAYPARYGSAVNALTRGRLAAAPAKQRMSEHVTLLMGQADAYAAAEFPAAFARERTAYSGIFDHGTAFAKAAVLKRLGYLPIAFDDRATKLRSGMGRLLGEHSELSYELARDVVSSKPAAEAAGNALNRNTEDLLVALGGSTANQFGDGWATYIDELVNFSVAVAEYDIEGQARARAALDAAPANIGARLSELSGGKIAAGSVARAVKLQTEQILRGVTAYAALDYGASHDLAYAKYNQAFTLAGKVAGILENVTAAKAPRGGAKTGSGGLASR